MMREGLLVVWPYAHDPEPNLEYSGFDGEFWPSAPRNDPLLEEGVAPLVKLQSIMIIAKEAKSLCERARLIAISDKGMCLEEYVFYGFDVGVLENAFDQFSFSLNDILNTHGLFRAEAASLNEHSLFGAEADAERFAVA